MDHQEGKLCRMNLLSIGLIMILCLINTILATNDPDSYLVNCAFINKFKVDPDGRIWNWPPRVIVTGRPECEESIGTEGLNGTTFRYAFISPEEFELRFPIQDPGRKIIRLYFYFASYKGDFDVKDLDFTVKAVMGVDSYDLVLDSNTMQYVGSTLEFSLPVLSNELRLIFTPSKRSSISIAIVTGIEIVSEPNDIYIGNPILVGEGVPFNISNRTPLQNIARLNVGGDDVRSQDDSGQLFRYWSNDDSMFFGGKPGIRVDGAKTNVRVVYPTEISKYRAPNLVYRTARTMGPDPDYTNFIYNMTWRIPAFPDSFNLVRLHFCEVVGGIYDVKDRIFSIYLNGVTVESGADVIAWTGKPGVPVVKDYVVYISDSSEISVDMTPNMYMGSVYNDTLLNGIEIFKIFPLL